MTYRPTRRAAALAATAALLASLAGCSGGCGGSSGPVVTPLPKAEQDLCLIAQAYCGLFEETGPLDALPFFDLSEKVLCV